jgi:hypothetical protein
MRMMRTTVYQVGDQVVPVDLPRQLLCQVESTDEVALADGESGQILTLRPLGGPWEQGTTLVRLDTAVRPAGRHTTSNRTRRPARVTVARC